MDIGLRQQLKLSQQLIMTPQLQQAIKLLQLNRMELVEKVKEELEENPALEEVEPDDPGDEPLTEMKEPSLDDLYPEREVAINEKINDEIDWDKYFENVGQSGKVNYETEAREMPAFETFTAKKESLTEHLLWQLLDMRPTPEEERIGSLIAGNLTPRGYLDTSTEEIADLSGSPIEKVNDVLQKMQAFDPVGACARDLKECLRVQAVNYGVDDAVVISIIDSCLTHVENRNYKAICKALRIGMDEVTAAVNTIRELEPDPGRQYGGEEVQYIEPDIYVYEYDNDFVIELNDNGLPKLRVSDYYKEAFSSDSRVGAEAKEYLNDKLRNAFWLIRSINQREKTIYQVMESILKFQKEFFRKGVLKLRPMVLKDVAMDIDKHESTISRVTTNKYAYTPQGIYELKYFFNSSIARHGADPMASASVQERIRQIIDGESPAKPYSDQSIADMLNAEDIEIARRTVAKYREMMNILPSSKRKRPQGGI